jgi:hypothetical protein
MIPSENCFSDIKYGFKRERERHTHTHTETTEDGKLLQESDTIPSHGSSWSSLDDQLPNLLSRQVEKKTPLVGRDRNKNFFYCI